MLPHQRPGRKTVGSLHRVFQLQRMEHGPRRVPAGVWAPPALGIHRLSTELSSIPPTPMRSNDCLAKTLSMAGPILLLILVLAMPSMALTDYWPST